MKLFRVKLSGYKRFLEETTLKINGKMTALIGPNEAGKTSILNALAHLSHDKEFSPAERYKFGERKEEVEVNIVAEFFLDEEDHVAIGSKIPKKYILTKNDDGSRTHSIYPKIQRAKEHRSKFKQSLLKCLNSVKFAAIVDNLETAIETDVELLISSLNDVDMDADNIAEKLGFLDEISELIEEVRFDGLPKYIADIPSKIDGFIELENQDHPNKIALNVIGQRCPDFLKFTIEDRKLEPKYNITLYNHEDPEKAKVPCNALKSLCSISGLNLDLIKSYLDDAASDQIASQFTNANQKLKSLFKKTWSQSDISIHLSWQKPEVEILVEQRNGANSSIKHNLIEQRSDGFQQYVALLAFILGNKSEQKPILLIDEADLHLHYDAQADLVQTFTARELTSQIVYTTHSAGCLPEDLGGGVKLVEPIEDGDNSATSRIENNFWVHETQGFSPILYGLGAKTMAFFPTRNAVVVEGQTEMLLLPTIFRQASGSDSNGFQVVPGLANSKNENLPVFELQGERVSYLVDNDKAGCDYFNNLSVQNVPEEKIFKIGNPSNEIITIEDLISDDCFDEAMTIYYSRFFAGKDLFKTEFFDGCGKAEKLEKYEKQIDVKISKPKLAYIILEGLDNDPSKPIFNTRFKRDIKNLRDEIITSFEEVK